MDGGEVRLRLHAQVLDESDVLRAERLTRALRDTVATGADVTCSLATGATTAPSPSHHQTQAAEAPKGDPAFDPHLWLAIGAVSTTAARVAVEAIRAWSQREQSRRVRITVDGGDVTLEVSGGSGEAHERAVSAFLDHIDRLER